MYVNLHKADLCRATVDRITSLNCDYNMLPQKRPELLYCIAGLYTFNSTRCTLNKVNVVCVE